jgi:aryl-alcohol dehydrogenase-like predicted oxidoreductase
MQLVEVVKTIAAAHEASAAQVALAWLLAQRHRHRPLAITWPGSAAARGGLVQLRQILRRQHQLNMQLVEVVKTIAAAHEASAAQVALAWLLAQGDDILCASPREPKSEPRHRHRPLAITWPGSAAARGGLVAAAHEASAAQVALAWLLAQGDDIVPIPGSKRRTA